jgi:hypothetical protein
MTVAEQTTESPRQGAIKIMGEMLESWDKKQTIPQTLLNRARRYVGRWGQDGAMAGNKPGMAAASDPPQKRQRRARTETAAAPKGGGGKKGGGKKGGY